MTLFKLFKLGDCISDRTCNIIIVGGNRMWRCTYYARTAVRIHPFGASMFIYQVQFMGTLHVRTPNKEASKRLGLFVLCRHTVSYTHLTLPTKA